jgi:hypothetical protein
MFSRRILEPVVLDGRTVQAGTMCLVSPALLHRDRGGGLSPNGSGRTAGCGTNRARPTASTPSLPGHRAHHLPFGAGPRMYRGQFAWSEATTMLASWAARGASTYPTPRPPGDPNDVAANGPVQATTSRTPDPGGRLAGQFRSLALVKRSRLPWKYSRTLAVCPRPASPSRTPDKGGHCWIFAIGWLALLVRLVVGLSLLNQARRAVPRPTDDSARELDSGPAPPEGRP